MFTQPFHVFDNPNTSLSEGEALAAVVGDFPETPHWTRNDKHFPRPLRINEARLCLAGPPSVRRNGAPQERSAGGESDPRFLTASAASGRVSRFTSQFTVKPLLGGVALTTVIPTDCFVAYHNPSIKSRLRVLDDVLPPIRSTVMKEIPLALRGCQRTCVVSGTPPRPVKPETPLEAQKC